MRTYAVIAVALASLACGKVDDPPTDAGPPPPQCDLKKPFGPPQAITELNTDESEEFGSLSSDQLTIYFTRGTPGMWRMYKTVDYHVYIATRASKTEPFGPAKTLAAVNTPSTDSAQGYDAQPAVTGNGLTMYFTSNGFGLGGGAEGIFVMHRSNKAEAFSNPMLLTSSLDLDAVTSALFVTFDGGTIFFSRRAILGKTVASYSATCASNGCTPAQRFWEFGDANDVVMSADRLTAFYVKGGYNVITNTDDSYMYTASRSSASDPFAPETPVNELSGSTMQFLPRWLSPDGCTMYMDGLAPKGKPHLYVANRP